MGSGLERGRGDALMLRSVGVVETDSQRRKGEIARQKVT